jgi:hypothetical protein
MLTQIIILSNPYIWHLFLICIHRGPSGPHICRLLSPHLWYRYVEIEKWCTLCCARLLFPSWLKYPLLELGQFVLQFIFQFFYSYWLSLQVTIYCYFFSLGSSQPSTNTPTKTWKVKTLSIMASSTSQCPIIILFWRFHVKTKYSWTYIKALFIFLHSFFLWINMLYQFQ